MNCREFQEYIGDRVAGEELPAPLTERLEEHIAGCPGCAGLLRETEEVWRALGVLEKVSFPESLSRRVLAAAAPRPAPLRFFRKPLPAGRLILAAASIVLAAGLYLILPRPERPGPETSLPILRQAITYSPRPPTVPDPAATLEHYLREVEDILVGLENGSYGTWGMVLADIISRDIQGRSNFLLESRELNPRARETVGSLHQAFWNLLQSGRGREGRPVELPPGVDTALLRSKIEQYREFSRAQAR